MHRKHVPVDEARSKAHSNSFALIDAHVHYHACFERVSFLASAERNFSEAAGVMGLPSRPLGVLLLTESAGQNWFRRFRSEIDRKQNGGWVFRDTAENVSLLALRGGKVRLVLVAGRQIVTAENLEVLALGCQNEIRDGRVLDDALKAVQDAGALAVVPWGFGKWWFRRGRLVAELLHRQDSSVFFLGDNGGRLHWGPPPRLFATARRLGVRVLPGSDPFPFAREVGRAGSYGFVLCSALGPEAPTENLKQILTDPRVVPAPYGRGQGLLRFCRNQSAMQIRKHATSEPQ